MAKEIKEFDSYTEALEAAKNEIGICGDSISEVDGKLDRLL